MLCYLLLLTGLCWERLRGKSRLRDSAVTPWFRPCLGVPGLSTLVAGLIVLFLLQLMIVAFLAQDDSVTRGAIRFPLNIVDDRIGTQSSHRGAATAMMLVLALLQTVGLATLSRALVDGGRAARWIVAAGAVTMYGMALLAPALTSADMYSYSGYSLLGGRAYAPPAVPFPSQFASINLWWHTPMEPAPYGPLWIHYNRILLALAPTLFLKFAILRCAGVVWLLVVLRCVALQRVPLHILSLLALNPAIAFQFISNGHNDVVGVGIALLGLTAARLGPWFQAPFVVAAGLIKLPFVAVAVVMLRGSLRTRLTVAGVSTFATIAASLLFGGPSYVDSLMHHAHTHALMFGVAHSVLLLYVLGAIAVALILNRWSVVAPLCFPSLAAAMFPWYILWGLPYALAGRSLPFFLIALPLASFLFDPIYETLWLLLAATLAVSASSVWEILNKRRRATSLGAEAFHGA